MATPDDARLCGRCGYDVRGLPTAVCPECGGDLREVGTRRPDGRREAAAWLVSALLLAGIVTIYGGALVYGLMPERLQVGRLLIVDVTDGKGGAAAPGAFVAERETTRIRVPLTTRWWTARSVERAWLRPAGRPGVRLAEYPPLTDAQRRVPGGSTSCGVTRRARTSCPARRRSRTAASASRALGSRGGGGGRGRLAGQERLGTVRNPWPGLTARSGARPRTGWKPWPRGSGTFPVAAVLRTVVRGGPDRLELRSAGPQLPPRRVLERLLAQPQTPGPVPRPSGRASHRRCPRPAGRTRPEGRGTGPTGQFGPALRRRAAAVGGSTSCGATA